MKNKKDQTSGRRGEEEKKKSEAGTNGEERRTKRRRSSRKTKKEEKEEKRRGARDGYSKRQYYAESRSYGTREKLATVRIDRPISGAQQQQQQRQDAGVQKCRRWWRHPTSPGVVDPKMSLLRDSLTTVSFPTPESRNGANLDHTTIGAVPNYGISLGQQALSLVSILFLSTPSLSTPPEQYREQKTRKCSKQPFGGIARKFDQGARRSLAALRPDLEGFGWFLGGRIAWKRRQGKRWWCMSRLGAAATAAGKVGGAAEDGMHFSPACR
ncbi:uncharacterized protein An18g03420 [Aspergillus niger]|uniref:Contig An18c0100, genomic contig n=2 Tax=Aspergillus niger TaxID=5061 RepID=A2RAK2_ASPNC|nr:uncharacterized protein An18g03420 [Aspergillus niger]CAK48728.1 unnamed protein product [Aspergillus niger]